jgi:hypothetical protein
VRRTANTVRAPLRVFELYVADVFTPAVAVRDEEATDVLLDRSAVERDLATVVLDATDAVLLEATALWVPVREALAVLDAVALAVCALVAPDALLPELVWAHAVPAAVRLSRAAIRQIRLAVFQLNFRAMYCASPRGLRGALAVVRFVLSLCLSLSTIQLTKSSPGVTNPRKASSSIQRLVSTADYGPEVLSRKRFEPASKSQAQAKPACTTNPNPPVKPGPPGPIPLYSTVRAPDPLCCTLQTSPAGSDDSTAAAQKRWNIQLIRLRLLRL